MLQSPPTSEDVSVASVSPLSDRAGDFSYQHDMRSPPHLPDRHAGEMHYSSHLQERRAQLAAGGGDLYNTSGGGLELQRGTATTRVDGSRRGPINDSYSGRSVSNISGISGVNRSTISIAASATPDDVVERLLAHQQYESAQPRSPSVQSGDVFKSGLRRHADPMVAKTSQDIQRERVQNLQRIREEKNEKQAKEIALMRLFRVRARKQRELDETARVQKVATSASTTSLAKKGSRGDGRALPLAPTAAKARPAAKADAAQDSHLLTDAAIDAYFERPAFDKKPLHIVAHHPAMSLSNTHERSGRSGSVRVDGEHSEAAQHRGFSNATKKYM